MDAPHFQPAEDWLGMPVVRVWRDQHGNTVVNHEVLYGSMRLGCPASSPPKEESVTEALAAFDSMAESHRAAARQRVELSDAEQCVETVGSGVAVRRCSHRAKPGTRYCGRHPAEQSSSDDFESAPLIADAPDNFTWE